MMRLIPLIIILLFNIITLFIQPLKDIVLYLNIVYFLLLLFLWFKSLNSKNNNPIKKITEAKEYSPIKEEIIYERSQQDIECEEKYEICKNQILNLSEKFYYFSNSIPIIEALNKSTQEFETETLKKVFNQFELIWNESETLIKESEKSMDSIFETNGGSNLGYILNSSKEINRDFQNFLPLLESMKRLTEKFVNISMESFNTISKTTKDIEGLAEQVKVISINVRIEAARIKDSGGFKVLGTDISKFADKTSLFAKSTNDKIKNTIGTIDKLKTELTEKLKDVSISVKSMHGKINPFESILEESAISLKNVIGNLNKVSGELNSNLKTSLGNLQFQDITSQEMNHLIDFLRYVESTVFDSNKMEQFIKHIDEKDLKKDLLSQIDKISTTGNEAEVIAKFAKKWGIKFKEEIEENFNSIDDGTFLF